MTYFLRVTVLPFRSLMQDEITGLVKTFLNKREERDIGSLTILKDKKYIDKTILRGTRNLSIFIRRNGA